VQTGVGFGPQTSVAVTVKFTTAPATLVQSLVMSDGHTVMVGAVVSTTVTVWLQFTLVLPESSVKFHVRVAVKVFRR